MLPDWPRIANFSAVLAHASFVPQFDPVMTESQKFARSCSFGGGDHAGAHDEFNGGGKVSPIDRAA
jgi:hypothetical protein